MLIRHTVRRQHGFTLIELMLAVTVLAVILGLGAPSFQTFIENTRVRAAAEALLSGMQLARAEAVRRNTDVAFVLSPNMGWSVMAGTATIQSRSAAEGAATVPPAITPTTATTVTFNGMGRVATNTDGSPSLTRIVVTGGTKRRRLDIGNGGLIRMCDPDVTTAGDPRVC